MPVEVLEICLAICPIICGLPFPKVNPRRGKKWLFRLIPLGCLPSRLLLRASRASCLPSRSARAGLPARSGVVGRSCEAHGCPGFLIQVPTFTTVLILPPASRAGRVGSWLLLAACLASLFRFWGRGKRSVPDVKKGLVPEGTGHVLVVNGAFHDLLVADLAIVVGADGSSGTPVLKGLQVVPERGHGVLGGVDGMG